MPAIPLLVLRGLALLLLLSTSGMPAARVAAVSPRSAKPGVPAPGDGRLFVVGASYQGPADRAWGGEYWAGWADDRFDPALVSADFERAAGAGLNTLRIFVQRELVRDLQRGLWWKLDAVLDLAVRHRLLLIVTFGDYDETRVGEVARISAEIARRYAGHPAILAYDLRNEPNVWTLLETRYPDDRRPALLGPTLVEAYGERASRAYVAAFRATPEGKRGSQGIPERLTDEEAYSYHNAWLLSYELARDARAIA